MITLLRFLLVPWQHDGRLSSRLAKRIFIDPVAIATTISIWRRATANCGLAYVSAQRRAEINGNCNAVPVKNPSHELPCVLAIGPYSNYSHIGYWTKMGENGHTLKITKIKQIDTLEKHEGQGVK